MKTNKPLRSTSRLQAKTGLKARTRLKANKKPRKQPTPSLTTLRKKADKIVSRAVRIRDADYIDGAWQGQCITCERICTVIDANGRWQKSNGWGHFIGRGHYYLRYWPENINLQCSHCNAWRDKDSMLQAYREALEYKYGYGTVLRLKQMEEQYRDFRLTKVYLEEIIHDSTEELDFYLKLPYSLA